MLWRVFLVLISISVLLPIANAQLPSVVDMQFHAGKLLRHSSSLSFPSPPMMTAQSIQVLWPRTNVKGKPIYIGTQLYHAQLANREVLGHVTTVLPTLWLPLRNPERKLSAHYTMSTGLSWSNKVYNALTNTENNALSSRVNFGFQMGFQFAYCTKSPWQVRSGVELTHFSNGAASIPNLGINLLTGSLGVRYERMEATAKPITPREFKRKTQFSVFSGLSMSESTNAGGFRSPFYTLGVGVGRQQRQGIWWLQVRSEWPMAQYRFLMYTQQAQNKQEALSTIRRTAIAVGKEYFVGRVSLFGYLGTYAQNPTDPGSVKVFEILGGHVNLSNREQRVQPFIGLNMKAHLSVAEYFMLVAGFRF